MIRALLILEVRMAENGGMLHGFRRVWYGLNALNLNALRILLTKGKSTASQYLTQSHRLYSGYGMPWKWSDLPWRTDMKVPQIAVQDLFPEIDFTRSPELLFPFPRDLSTMAHVVDSLRPQRIVEFGTAEGRTALNFALHLPTDGEVITLDFPSLPGKNDVGYFYWDQPLKSKIKQIFCSVGEWDSTSYRASAEVVFCDACDRLPGLADEAMQAFSVVKPGGVIFRHDYGSAKGPTLFWNEIARELPVKHLEGTALLCLRVNDSEVYEKMQSMVSSGQLGNLG
jgi:hypothetical protein